MKIGFIGLGRMGFNMVLNLLEHNHEIVVYNRSFEQTKKIAKKGAIPSFSYEELTSKLPKRKIIFIMITSGKPVDEVINSLIPYLNKGDILIDGGNSYYKDSQKRYEKLKKIGVNFLDVGVSGGVDASRHGCAIMVGGDKLVFQKTKPILEDLASKNGCGYLGKTGAGHFVKAIHNGIEYGMMASISEGLSVLNNKKNELNIDLKNAVRVYANGSILDSKLMSWFEEGLDREDFSKISGKTLKGETEDEMKKIAKENKMSFLKEAILMREKTRKKESFAGKLIGIVRNEFGGHKFNRKK